MSSSAEAPEPTNFYRAWVLGLLTLLYFLYLLDRTAIIVTQELIKKEFALTDTQMGFVIGTVYGISYGIAGLPVGWLVDRVNRRNLLVAILSVWSGLTALCGASTAYWHLVIARIGVGASEAGGSPASLSILSSIYPPSRRATVASIFYSGTGLGMIASYFLGGLIAAELGWRAVFLAYGLPGLLLALLIFLTVKEPPRSADAKVAPRGNLFASAKTLLSDPLLARVYLGAVLYCLATAAVGSWMIAFLMREHGASVATAGAIIAGAIGACGIVGSILIGIICDKVGARIPGGTLLVMALAAIINVSAGMMALGSSSLPTAIVFLCLFGATSTAYSGPSNAVISSLAPPASLGMGFALFALLCNLVGSGFGPIAVGFLSDHMGGKLSLAMQIMLSINALAAIVLFATARRFRARAAEAVV